MRIDQQQAERDSQSMIRALQMAEKALTAGEVPVGAVVSDGERILSEAMNEREMRQDPTAHAEVLALQRAAAALGTRRLSGLTLYVTLEPCPMCAGAAVAAGIDRIVFGAADPKSGCCGSVYAIPEDPAFGKQILCDGPLMDAQAREILDRFFTEHRRTQTVPSPSGNRHSTKRSRP